MKTANTYKKLNEFLFRRIPNYDRLLLADLQQPRPKFETLLEDRNRVSNSNRKLLRLYSDLTCCVHKSSEYKRISALIWNTYRLKPGKVADRISLERSVNAIWNTIEERTKEWLAHLSPKLRKQEAKKRRGLATLYTACWSSSRWPIVSSSTRE